MPTPNAWFEDFKKSAAMRIIDPDNASIDNEQSAKVRSVAEKALSTLTFEELIKFIAKDVPNMTLTEDTSAYRLCTILVSIYLNNRVEEDLGPGAAGLVVRLD